MEDKILNATEAIIEQVKRWGEITLGEVEFDGYTHTEMAQFVKIPVESLETIIKEQLRKI